MASYKISAIIIENIFISSGANMIGKLTGTIDNIASDHIILNVNGVGYLVYTLSTTIQNFNQPNLSISLLIHTQVKEDSITLFGFGTEIEKTWFNKLISVKGVGPKLALLILSNIGTESLQSAILAQDKNIFANISGVGKKIAERIVTELKDSKLQIVQVNTSSQAINNNFQDAILALDNLGFVKTQAYEICNKIIKDQPSISTSDLIKKALGELSK